MKIKILIKKIFNYLIYPSLFVKKMPKNRPSKRSIYYLINQLGKDKPIGLTHDLSKGYHELPFKELRFPVTRNDLSKRLSRLKKNYSFDNKYGIDVGCAQGGITFGLQKNGANLVGIDRHKPSIDIAKECEAYFKTGANFINIDLDKEKFLELLMSYSNPKTKKFDFIIWFSSFNWVAEALGEKELKLLINIISENTNTLIADSSIGGKGQAFLTEIGIFDNKTFAEFITRNSAYKSFKIIGKDEDWYGREIFIFS